MEPWTTLINFSFPKRMESSHSLLQVCNFTTQHSFMNPSVPSKHFEAEPTFEIAFTFPVEKPSSDTMQDMSFDDLFVEDLFQLEADCYTELSIDNVCSSGYIGPACPAKENVIGSMEDSYHFLGFQEMNADIILTDLLLTGAHAVEASNLTLASNMIAMISNILLDQEEEDKSFSNVIFALIQGLSYRCRDTPALMEHELVPMQKETMSAIQMLQELSPHMKFAQFTGNQAILENIPEEGETHVLDLNIMEGSQWPPLMADLAQRKDVSLRITAIVGDSQTAALVQHTGRRLVDFAKSVCLPFKFDQMVIEKEEDFNRIDGGRTMIANCMIHQHITNRNFSMVKTFLNGVTKLSPKLVILVEEELLNFVKVSSMSYTEFFHEAIQHYTALSDSLVDSFTSMGFRFFLKEIMGPMILHSARNFPIKREEKMLWDDTFSFLKELEAIPMRAINVSQAKLMAGLFGKELWIKHENFRLSLCWKSRPLTTLSVWVPRYAQGK